MAGTHFNVYLPEVSREQLLELRARTGKRSLSDTIRAALDLYQLLVEHAKAGRRIWIEELPAVPEATHGQMQELDLLGRGPSLFQG
jgi:hypothetical protein